MKQQQYGKCYLFTTLIILVFLLLWIKFKKGTLYFRLSIIVKLKLSGVKLV